ncbi:CaiB/BaiF CoA transferase family protein [Biformimicrobium ophioploci]|uniref:CaiB/BaiF CoA-transferase family protein n=1 Tax=Biformimicrobium ophioploci TaxID=3036711 RepID=A0ABQ6M231_9GAMM|nr:CaiB/BaiF CoA-transferase family protein [Microbulbifer sp. NKW57]GMG88416.1 CaiB/BaiF CoA-transferase family protein [Microbulbifer sp. NKW57]
MGVLNGIRVIELSGMGPCPMAGMLLADMGAEVIRVERSLKRDPIYAKDMSARGKKSIVINLKSEDGRAALLQLVAGADVLLEGFRPGVAEKLGIGPEECAQRNPRLVYGRMTGWGQDGPLAKAAGHDINYIALTGALHAIGRSGEKPAVPVNLIGDFGGGTMFLVMGVLGALLEAQRSGRGQVVDAAMVDGAANLMWMCHSFSAAGLWDASGRGNNLLDGGAFFYDTYETSDSKYIAVGAIEPQFYAELVQKAGLDPQRFNAGNQNNRAQWPENAAAFAEVFRTRTRAEWCELLEGTDACVAPVLSADEAPDHPHNRAREAYIDVDGYAQPAPAPRFSRTPSTVSGGQHAPGADTEQVLRAVGYSEEQVADLKAQGAVA